MTAKLNNVESCRLKPFHTETHSLNAIIQWDKSSHNVEKSHMKSYDIESRKAHGKDSEPYPFRLYCVHIIISKKQNSIQFYTYCITVVEFVTTRDSHKLYIFRTSFTFSALKRILCQLRSRRMRPVRQVGHFGERSEP